MIGSAIVARQETAHLTATQDNHPPATLKVLVQSARLTAVADQGPSGGATTQEQRVDLLLLSDGPAELHLPSPVGSSSYKLYVNGLLQRNDSFTIQSSGSIVSVPYEDLFAGDTLSFTYYP